MTARRSTRVTLDPRKTKKDIVAARAEQIGIQSVEVAGNILKALATLDGPQTLSVVSAAAGLPPAKVHRYLVSLIREGFVEQSSLDGRYDFGGTARLIGRVAMNRLDIMRVGRQLLSELKDQIQETVFLGAWTPEGPMVFEWFDIVRPVSVVIRPGSILPLHTSAFGLICVAYLPEDVVARALDAEKPQPLLRSQRLTKTEQVTIVKEIRKNGFSVVKGDLIRGLDAVAVPVLNHQGDLVACLAAVGSSGMLDIAANGRVVRGLQDASRRFSELLG